MDKERDEKKKILSVAELERLLTQRDQQGLISDILLSFQRSFAQLRERAEKRMSLLKKNLQEGLLASETDLDQVRDRLLKAFQQIYPADFSKSSLQASIETIERSLAELYQTIPVNLGSLLESASPRTRFVENLLEELTAFYLELVGKIPERVTLIQSRRSQERERNGGIPSGEQEAMIHSSARSRISAVNWLCLQFRRLRLTLRYKAVEVPLRETVSLHLLGFQLLEERSLVREHKAIYSEARSCISDSWQIVRFNLEVAAAELSEMLEGINASTSPEGGKDGIAEIQKLVLEGVDRTRERLRGVFDPFGILAAELLLQIDQEHEEDMNSIRQDIEEAGTLRVRLRWFRADFVQRLHRLLEKSSAVVMKVLRATFLVGKERYYEAETLALKIAPSLGLAVPTRESLQRLTDLPTYEEVYGKSKKIPPVYRRLFTPQPLLTKEFLVAREEALDSLFESVKRWQAGRPCSVAIVGPQGSGKTSLLNCFTNEVRSKVFLEKKEVKDRLGGKEEVFRLFENWFSLSKTCDSVSDVVSQLLEQKKRIVLVEGGHNLILRTIGGGTTAETFFSIVLGTRDHLLWILSVRQYPWQRMEYQLRASQYFTHEIRTLFHDEQELSEALMLRQRVSGFRLIYSDEGLDTRRINKLRLRNPLEAEVVQRELEKEYFKSLFELSGGNLESALFFWLLSSSYEESENVVRVAPCVTLDYRFLRRFDNQILFSLAELTNHGGLTLAEHSEIFRLDPSKSRLILDYLVEIRLVDCKSQGDERMPVYVVNPIVLHPVATLLESLNILY